MSNLVLVWKCNRRADLHGGHVGHELFVALIDDRLIARALKFRAVAFRDDHRVGNERAFRVLNRDVERTGVRVAGQRKDRDESESARPFHLISKRDHRFDEVIVVFERKVRGHSVFVGNLDG